LLSACQPPAPVSPTAQTTPAPVWPDWNDRDVFKSGLIPSEWHILDELPDAPAYRLDLTIDPDMVHIHGDESLRYTNHSGDLLDELQLHLYPNLLGGDLTVKSVHVNGIALPYEASDKRSVLHIPLDEALRPSNSIIVNIRFETTVPTELTSNYGILASAEGVLALAHAYPSIAIYNEGRWATEIPAEQGDVTYAEAGFFYVRVHAPRKLMLIASGSEVARSEADGLQNVTYAAGPVRDFYLAASEDYVRSSRDTGSYIINSYAPVDDQAGSDLALRVAAESLAFYADQFGAYPYSEFDIVATPTYALGIEYPGMTAVNVEIYDLSASFGETPAAAYLETTIAHEVGHQWFYNLVGNDQLEEPWLDESLTQYITWQYYLHTYGTEGAAEFEDSLRRRWQRGGNKDTALDLPVSAYQVDQYSAIIYGRGALFFDALAAEMGADAFSRFLHDYAETFRWQIATTKELQNTAEKACACDLTEIFNQWVYPAK
jgi:aminopeptidase N